jgi:hemoglobin
VVPDGPSYHRAVSTIYLRIGGAEGIDRLVDRFYDKVLADPELAFFFTRTPMERLRAMQREFFTAGTGGPVAYSGMSLLDAHAGRGIGERQYSLFVRHLLETLAELDLSSDDIAAVADRLALYRDDVVEAPGNPD